jgi:phosphoglycolate phosphatase
MFDLDGTLVDSRGDIAVAVNLTLDDLDLPARKPEDVYGFIGGGVHNLILRSMPEGMDGLLEKGVEMFWEHYRAHVLDSTKLYPGVYAMLERLSGRKMAVVTNKPYAHTHMILQGLDIDRYFASVQGWKVGIKVKPDPELLNRALGDTGVAAKDSILIGDSMADVLAARAAGSACCAVAYGYGAKEKIIEASPDYFAEEVGDIYRLFG